MNTDTIETLRLKKRLPAPCNNGCSILNKAKLFLARCAGMVGRVVGIIVGRWLTQGRKESSDLQAMTEKVLKHREKFNSKCVYFCSLKKVFLVLYPEQNCGCYSIY
jgi:hypothetical protein